MFFKSKPTPAPAEIAGVRVKPSSRARRMSLRVEAKSGEVILVWPRRGSEQTAMRFIARNRDWIEKKRAEAVPPVEIAPGMTLALLGRNYTVLHKPGRGITRIAGDHIIVHGDAAHLRRRLKDFVKKEAAGILAERTREKTESLGLPVKSIRILDPRTRWGSCGHDGRIMFSWRLLLAPEAVMDYVVAHEVAHRVHMNHSRKFWTLCASLTQDAAASRRWLRDHGNMLQGLL